MAVESSEMEQLKQLIRVTWDGNLIDKYARNRLVARGYARHFDGWNFLTKAGVQALVDFGLLKV